MNKPQTTDAFGVLSDPDTLTIQRRLPGTIERVWDYLVESDLRRRWLASGEMKMLVGAPFELVWRNDELTNPPGERPSGFGDEHRMKSEITELDPPHKLAFTWGNTGGVTMELQAQGKEVLLTVTHRRLPDRSTLLGVSTGWHKHLDLLVARLKGEEPAPFWDNWATVKGEYDRRLPADAPKAG